jgi:hypothetical protein
MADLKVFVTTSDYYNHLMPGFAYLFNRYWSSKQEVHILCYTKPSYALPENFSMTSLGSPTSFGNEIPEWAEGRRGAGAELWPTPQWTNSLRPLFERLTDAHFILMQIDYFLARPVAVDRIAFLMSFLCSRNVAKIDLTLDRARFPHSLYATHGGVQIIASQQTASYRSSLQAAIWRTDYFLPLLKPDRSPWDFEEMGMEEIRNDGKLILGIRQPEFAPVSYANLYARGKVDWREMEKIDAGVREEMFGLGLIREDWNGWDYSRTYTRAPLR